jgi:hypothetical protein
MTKSSPTDNIINYVESLQTRYVKKNDINLTKPNNNFQKNLGCYLLRYILFVNDFGPLISVRALDNFHFYKYF